MMFNENLNCARATLQFYLKLLLMTLSVLLASCTTTHIPGLDQILFPNSSAKVGPVVTADQQYPLGNENAPSETESNPVVDSLDGLPEAQGEAKAVQTPNIETKSTSTIQPPTSQAKAPPKDDGAAASPAIKVPSASLEPRSREKKLPAIPKKKATAAARTDYGALAGKVVLIGENGQPLPATGTLITLTPKQAADKALGHSPVRHIIDMEDKEYQPRYSSINAGDQVVFVNKDNIRHNVFSSSGGNAFDLGTYGAGLKRAVTLKEPGIVKIYCNIHADMATFIAVGDQGLSTKADEQGSYQFDNLPPATYDITIWNIRGETKGVVEIKANQTAKLVDRVDTTAFKIESHKNKFGGNYSKSAALFEDEFY